jgi:hypothetical protein
MARRAERDGKGAIGKLMSRQGSEEQKSKTQCAKFVHGADPPV